MTTDKQIKPMKKKQPSKQTIKNRAWLSFSKYIRLRDCLKTTGTVDYGKCITCGKLVPITSSDAGHFISRRFSSTLFDETNVNLQCRFCNRFRFGVLLEYRRQIIKRYGEGHDIYLEDKAIEIKKFTLEELTSLAKEYKIKVKELIA